MDETVIAPNFPAAPTESATPQPAQTNFTTIPAASSTQYPQLTNVTRSARTVQILKNLAYGKHSELTALTTYLRQDWGLGQSYPDFASTLEKIAIVEMHHLDELSNAIAAFGGNADYSVDGAYWSASAVNQNTSLPSLLEQNIVSEQNAIACYRQAISQIDNQSLIALIEKIISDEEQHILILQNMLDNYQ